MNKILKFAYLFVIAVLLLCACDPLFGGTNLTATNTPTPTVTMSPTAIKVPATPADVKATVEAAVVATMVAQSKPTEKPVEPTATSAPVNLPTATCPPPAPMPTEIIPVPATADVMGSSPDPMTAFFPIDDEIHGRFANDALLPVNLSVESCYRPWQAINPDRSDSKNATWIALMCDMKTTNQSIKLEFIEPWHIHISGTGKFEFVLIRDLRAIEQLKAKNIWNGKDPYDVSVAGDWSKQSKTLSIYMKGTGVVADTVDGWVNLTNNWYQAPFPKNMADGYIFRLDMTPGIVGNNGTGDFELWIGSSEYMIPILNTGGLHSTINLPVLPADPK